LWRFLLDALSLEFNLQVAVTKSKLKLEL